MRHERDGSPSPSSARGHEFLVYAVTGLLSACAGAAALPLPARPAVQVTSRVDLPTRASQGELVTGRVPTGSRVLFGGRTISVADDGAIVFGIARTATGLSPIRIERPGATPLVVQITIVPRDWPIERIDGVPPSTVNPPPAIAARIEAEQARVAAARGRDDPRDDYLQPFMRPVEGRISGRFGNQRVYNGTPGAPHSGMDIAAAQGAPVRAPAAGIVTFADPGLYLTGGTVVLDHGRGVSSNFLHLSRIDVHVGERVAQGAVIGAVGATGRATGPHLHWGMNWFDVRIDPLLVLERGSRPRR